MKLFLFSDLHLKPQNSLEKKLLRILLGDVGPSDRVIFFGDVFDVFSGANPYFFEQYADFFSTLKTLTTKGVAVEFIEGNHDLHLAPKLQEICGARVLGDSTEVTFQQKRLYIAHGDLVDGSDRKYLWLRKKMRSAWVRGLFARLPGKIVEKIGQAMSGTSKATHQNLSASPEVRKKFRKFAEAKFLEGFDYVVLGHCHDFDEWIAGEKQYINTGYPPIHGHYLVFNEGDPKVQRASF